MRLGSGGNRAIPAAVSRKSQARFSQACRGPSRVHPERAAAEEEAGAEGPDTECRPLPSFRPGRSSLPAAAAVEVEGAGKARPPRSPNRRGRCGWRVSWRMPRPQPEARVGLVSSYSLSLVISARQRSLSRPVPIARKPRTSSSFESEFFHGAMTWSAFGLIR